MRSKIAATIVFAAVATTGLSYAQAAMVNGEVKKIDGASGKITLKHRPIKNLDMDEDGMTMVFRIQDPSMLKQVKVGDTVQFEAKLRCSRNHYHEAAEGQLDGKVPPHADARHLHRRTNLGALMDAVSRSQESSLSESARTFDRSNGRLHGATVYDRALVMALQAGSIATQTFGHRGYRLGCRVVASVSGGGDILVRLNRDAVFAIPFGDGYWSRLLNRGYDYEEEIEAFLRSAAKERYFFVDCGANFGYWSVLASSEPFGRQPVLAIEAGPSNAQRLRRNSALNQDRFRCLNAAIDGTGGGFVSILGARHEKLATAPAKESAPGLVETVSLDGLVEAGLIDASLPVIVKLDVEGVEIDALTGGRALLGGDCAIICEEHGSDRSHGVSQHLMSVPSMRLYAFEKATARFARIERLETLERIKKYSWVGYNVIATSSPRWEERILTASWGRR